MLVLCGTLAGAEDFVEIRRWGQMHQEFLRRLRPFKAGIPSHDSLNDVINAIDGQPFADCFTAWVEGLREPAPASTTPEIVAIDGKTSRRTHGRGRDRGPLHMVSAWASSQRPSGGAAAGCFAVGSRRRDRAGAAGLRSQVQRDHHHRA